MHVVHWAKEYRATRGRLNELLRELGATEIDTMVPACPAWTVRDLVSHMTGLAAALSAGAGPSGDVQVWIDALVEERRELTIAQLLDEWEHAAPGIAEFFSHAGPNGGQLVYDLVAHEHDIRHALGRPGERDSSSVHACADAMSLLLSRDLGKHGLAAIRLTSAGHTWDVGPGKPGLAIALDPFELIRVFGARRSVAQLRALPWVGQLDPYLPAIAHFPLPVEDIVE